MQKSLIEVYKGFQRSASDADQLPELPVVPPDLTGTQGWLPAIELFGEGIFFFNKPTIHSRMGKSGNSSA